VIWHQLLTTAVAASAADSAIDHLSPQEEVRHHGHAQTWVLSARISCSAVALNRFGQKDTIPSFPPIEGFLELQGTQNRVHLSESTQSPAHYCDCGRHSPCPLRCFIWRRSPSNHFCSAMGSRFFPVSRIVSRNGQTWDYPGRTPGAEGHKKSGQVTAENPV